MYTDCTTEGISTPSACDRNIMDNISAFFFFCKGMRRIIPLSEIILAGNNICRILLCIVLETKLPRRKNNFFCNNSLYQKLENVCIHGARMQLSNPCSPNKQQRTEGEFWLSELRLGPALADSTNILSVGRKGVPGKILNNNRNNNSSHCFSLLLCCLIPDQVQVGGLEHLHISF